DPGDHVGGAGTGRRDRDAYSAARAREAVGHVRRALLVAHQHVPDRIPQHRVVRRQNRAARIAEDVGDALAHEAFPHDLRAREFHIVLTCSYPVTAPVDADDTRRAYFAKTPFAYRGAGRDQAASRRCTSSSVSATDSVRRSMSIVTTSPSRSAAMGPPRAASGDTWPTIRPRVAPEKRPSVMSATDSLRPTPTSAAVTASISRMPGPPLGPSLRITTQSFGRIDWR